MSKFKHDLLLRLIKLVDAVLMTIPFALCWYLYYSDRTASPFDQKGNLIVVLLFLVLFIIFGRIYDAFMMSIQQISEIVYAQFLAVAVSDLIIYVVICLLSKGLTNLLPGIAALVGQIILAFLWAYLAHHGYYATFPAKRTAIIYDVRRGFEKLIGKYGLDGKYDVVLTLCAEDCLKDLSVLDGIETVFASGIHSHDRNIILKYCIEHSINMFVIPRIGDVIMSGARHMHMFHLPMLTVSRYMASPEYLLAKRIIDIIVSALGLIVLSPILLVTAIAIKATDHGPVFYKQVRLTKNERVFFVGRGIDYAVCLEGSLKLKEISYIHSEAYAAGELKHGTISLIEQGTLVIGVLTQSELYEKTISNMLECKSRGAYLVGLTTYGKYEIEDQVNFIVYVPKVDEHFVGSLAVIPLQLLGYYVSVAKGLDVDKPRNLAKSVTVE